MPATGMNSYEFNHYRRVARNMNHYIAAAGNYGYQRRDGYGSASYGNMNFGPAFANQLYGWGFSAGVANLGYQVGRWFDVNL